MKISNSIHPQLYLTLIITIAQLVYHTYIIQNHTKYNIQLMIQQLNISTSPHYHHLKHSLKKLFIKMYKKSQSTVIIFSQRTSAIVFSLFTQSEIYASGYSKYTILTNIQSYNNYDKPVIVLTPACYTTVDLSDVCYLLKDVYVISLNISNSINEGIKRLKNVNFEGDGVKAILEQDMDFETYIEDVFVLQQGKPTYQKFGLLDNQNIMIDRMCSFLCSYPKFYKYSLNYCQDNKNVAERIAENLKGRFRVFEKHHIVEYDGSAPLIKVAIFSRQQNVSPFLNSLNYGPMLEQLKLAKTTTIISPHSKIYNCLYTLDIKKAAETLEYFASKFSNSKKQGVSFNNFNQIKKDLLQAYNPNMSAEQLRFHQSIFKQIHKFLNKNKEMIKLEMDLANGIDANGQSIKGGKLIERIMDWASGKQKKKGKQKQGIQKKQIPYQYYLKLVLLSLECHDFWWFQKNDLIHGLEEKHKKIIKYYIANSKKKCLKEPPATHNEEGEEIRSDLFRHQPEIVNRIINYLKGQMQGRQILEINKDKQNLKLEKQWKIIIFINDVLGFNQISMIKKRISDLQKKTGEEDHSVKLPNNMEIVCRGLMGTEEWTNWRIWGCNKK